MLQFFQHIQNVDNCAICTNQDIKKQRKALKPFSVLHFLLTANPVTIRKFVSDFLIVFYKIITVPVSALYCSAGAELLHREYLIVPFATA